MKELDRIKSYIGSNHYLIDEISRIQSLVNNETFEEFYEPVSVIEHVGKKKTLVNFTPQIINAWIKHVYYSTKTRMINFEHAALSELSQSRILTAMPLIRCHMEAAGMACLCESELRKLVKTSDEGPLRKLIPSTFLGSSLVRAQKKDKGLAGHLTLSEQDKVPIGGMISALDDFLTMGNPRGKAHGYYGLLCDFTHPNLRAVKDHTDTHDHPEEGWYHLYNIDGNLTPDHYLMGLDILLLSMKAGHGICQLLKRTSFEYHHDQAIMNSPDETELRQIWDNYLKYEKPA